MQHFLMQKHSSDCNIEKLCTDFSLVSLAPASSDTEYTHSGARPFLAEPLDATSLPLNATSLDLARHIRRVECSLYLPYVIYLLNHSSRA